MVRKVMVGDVAIGGDAKISIQSMSNIDTRNAKAVIQQIRELAIEGCDIVRVAVPDMESALAFGEIKKHTATPLVADIHFDYRLAIEAIKQGADKIRINPGNIGSRDELEKVVKAAKERKIPIRVGVNGGSLEKDIMKKYGGICPQAMVESANGSIAILENMNFEDIVVSLKASNPKLNFDTYMLMSKTCNYPLHIGVTEAGSVERGIIKSAVGIGALLLNGVGNTLRVSLTENPVKEVKAAKNILAACGIIDETIDVISCPTCGRTRVALESMVKEIENALVPVAREREDLKKPPIKIAVMGCEVNGPGEAKEADIGVACGNGKGVIFKKGKILKTVDEREIVKTLIHMVKSH